MPDKHFVRMQALYISMAGSSCIDFTLKSCSHLSLFQKFLTKFPVVVSCFSCNILLRLRLCWRNSFSFICPIPFGSCCSTFSCSLRHPRGLRVKDSIQPGIYLVYTKMIWNTCAWYILGIYQVYNRYIWDIPGIYQVYTRSRNTVIYTWYIPGIYLLYRWGWYIPSIYQVYTR